MNDMIWKPHVTVAAIIERDKRFLMVEEIIDGRLQINQPAGHLEDDESLIEATIRETREETAWEFTPNAVTGIYLWKHPVNQETYLRVAFCGAIHNHNPEQSLDHGITRTIWMTHDELINNKTMWRSPMVINCIEDYCNGQRYPLEVLTTVASQVKTKR